MRRRHLLVLPAAGALLAAVAAPLAMAQSTDGALVHRESILADVDATGTVGTSRVFTQLTVPDGFGEVVLPGQSTSGLRGLSGAGPSVDGDSLRFTGSGTIRTVANSTADLPVSIEIRYAVDGEEVAPRDVLGHDGEVAVTYVVRNLTAVPTELTLVDGDGATSTETVDVAVPMVGSLSMTLPGAFRDVVAPGAVVVGDGRGGTVVNWSLLLFSPLGSETQEVTWTAQATDAVVPSASLQVLPVTPDSFGSLGSTETAYAGAVDSTTELTGGAREIDTNLRRLAEGAGTLLAGLTQLQDGADELATGLVDAAGGAGDLSDGIGKARVGANELTTGLGDLATGANALSAGIGSARSGAVELGSGLGDLATGASQLSDGLGAAQAGGQQLTAGLGQLSAGANELASGAGELATGATTLNSRTGELVTGAGQLSAGAAQVLSGIEQLADGLTGSDGLPAAISGINQLRAGIGSATTSGTILNGLSLVAAGLVDAQDGIGGPAIDGTLRNGVAQVQGGLSNSRCDTSNPADPTNPCGLAEVNSLIGPGADDLETGLDALAATLSTIDDTALSLTDQGVLSAVISNLTASADGAALISDLSAGMASGIAQVQGGMALVDAGLVDLADGIGNAAAAGTLRNGVYRITAGVSNPACNPANPTDPTNPCGLLEGLTALRSGLSAAAGEVSDGLGSATEEGTLLWGATQVAGGSGELAAGATQLRTEGTAPLAAGAGEIRDGAAQVAAGAASALAGGEDLTDGIGRLAGGGLELTAGASRAAAGATALSDGLAQLDAGGAELADGAARAAAGGAELGNGLVRLDEGGAQLADGLGAAVDGSQQIADGLTSAADGGQQVADGSEQLVDEGTSVLADSVSEATVSSSLQLEQVRAVAARGIAGDGLPYPTAEGATATAVYQFDLAGVGSTDGPGAAGRFGIGAIALVLAFGAGLATRRRVIALHDADVPTTSDRVSA